MQKQYTSTSDATGILKTFAAHEDGPSVMCPRTEEIYDSDDTEELKTVSPISSVDDFCCEMSDIIKNIPTFELSYSKILEDGTTEVQEAADINSSNKDSTQFTSNATGILTPSAAHEDGPSFMCPRIEEIYDIDDTKELKQSLQLPAWMILAVRCHTL